MKRAIIAIAAVLAGVAVCEGRTITVDDDGGGDFLTIQAGIDDSDDGDTVLVADGVYTGDGNRDIDFDGKAITVKSENGPDNCIIDCNGTEAEPHRGFHFHDDERVNSILSGITVRNGYGESSGGGIRCSESSPTIIDCVIMNNVAEDGGGGLYSIDGSPIIENCRFVGNRAASLYGGAVRSVRGAGLVRNCGISGNSAAISGGGIALFETTMPIENCLITGNTAERDYGGGIYLAGCWLDVAGCTIVGNSAVQMGGGLYNRATVVEISNCIVRGNTASTDPEISSWDLYNTMDVSYSNVEGGYAGTGNIDADPCFADAGYWDPNGTPEDTNDDFWTDGDYHLKSQGARYDANEGRWTMDEVMSLCIDAGDPMSPVGSEPFPNGGRINVGAYAGTAEASRSYFGEPPCETIIAGDINGDGQVNYLDFQIMASHWLGGNEAINSNYRVEDGIEYYLEVDNFVYHSGQAVAMLYRVTNLGDQDVEFYFPNSPEWNFWVKMNGENVWTALIGWLTYMTWLELRPGEQKEYLYLWDVEDSEGALVGPGEYSVTGGFDAGTDGYGDYDFSKVSVTIEIEP